MRTRTVPADASALAVDVGTAAAGVATDVAVAALAAGAAAAGTPLLADGAVVGMLSPNDDAAGVAGAAADETAGAIPGGGE